MESLIALASDLYWEQDSGCRFTQLRSTTAELSLSMDDLDAAMGKAPWDIAGLAIENADWAGFREAMQGHQSFREVVWSWHKGSDRACFVSVCGEPLRDQDGNFSGYRGIMRNITEQRRHEDELRHFRRAMDISGDSIYFVDRETMRFTYVNNNACNVSGYTRAELLSMGPQDLLLTDRSELEKEYDEIIACGGRQRARESVARNRDGSTYVYELQRRPIRIEDRWVIISIARDITRRKEAEISALRFSRMYAAINGTNEAILHATTPTELFQQVCEVAVSGGQIINASILLPDPETEWACVAAVAGEGADTLRSIRISFNANRPEGQGLVGAAFRDKKARVSNDLVGAARVQPWRTTANQERLASGAALPLIRNGQSIGVLLLYSREKYAFDEQVIELLERMAQNIIFALGNFDRAIEKQQAENALRQNEEKYRGVLENMSDGYFEVDLKGNYTFVNTAMCKLHMGTKEEVLGLNYRDYMDADTAAYVRKVYNQVFHSGAQAELTEYKVWRRDGSACVAQTAMQLIIDKNGVPCGFRGVTRDNTERRDAEEALRASEEKYRSILESITDAYYEVDLAGNLVLYNDAFSRMTGYGLTEMIGWNYRKYQAKEDSAYVFTQFNEVYRTGVAKKGIDWRLLHKNGEKVLCEGSIHLIRDASGAATGFRGILRDVTKRREMETALRDSEERFRDLTELSSDWYWEQDGSYRFIQIDGDVFAKSGMPAEEYLGKTLWELPFDNLSPEQWAEHQRQLSEGAAFYELVLRTGGDRTQRYISVSGLPVIGPEGGLIGYRGTGKDITEKKTAEERIRHLASHDILTGLPNRMMFNQILSHTVQQARRYGRMFGVMFIDLDHFKEVNDTFGHDAGDILLKHTATRLTQSVRGSDFAARLAGDEFVVIVHEIRHPDELSAIAQKVVVALREPIVLSGSVHHVTASVGICVYPDDGQDEEALMKHADAAMYCVKRSNKDNFQFYSELTC
ncbi:MAG TPA: PAS domain S-box protein [Noviherbaspirillum sp.]|jgi:diguanylate cyclase (GGDEF)-like protein/PAS domain S-box-containing protein|uniref:PAS domain S-box protein n=1 Tax=Noviherbaspirillum sp. TaxID=1926288 RepID=UPI002DDCA7DE|nr:PAS domain S-box protein [Noviherbaspirillum sp.]HEV2610864.1 PAS domain S-box protein [Noviherbaspirillum sp.]